MLCLVGYTELDGRVDHRFCHHPRANFDNDRRGAVPEREL
jgi:hypothetical protein